METSEERLNNCDSLLNVCKRLEKYYTRRNNKMNKNNTGVYNYD